MIIREKNKISFNYSRELHVKYDKQDQQGRAGFNERNPHTTQQQETQMSETQMTL
jgi:hypothetical protein